MTSLLERDRLVINQKGKLLEIKTEFRIFDEDGEQVGSIQQEGQSALKKVLRFVSSVDQFLTHTLGVYDADGAKVCELTRPAKVFKSKVILKDAAGGEAGRIVQKNVFGKIRFDFVGSDGERIGGINAENWRAWNFSIVDAGDTEVGRITKKWAGLLKASFTNADHYVYEIDRRVQGPLRLFGLASAAGVDLALKQDSRGLG